MAVNWPISSASDAEATTARWLEALDRIRPKKVAVPKAKKLEASTEPAAAAENVAAEQLPVSVTSVPITA